VVTNSGVSQRGIERVEHSPVYGLVVEQLRRAIHMGTYIPGDKLPPERDLAKQLVVSRTTVREAIRVLEGEGYVESRRGAAGGVIVLDRGQTEQRAARLIREKLPELMEVVDFRLAVEGGAARLAAQRRTDEDLVRLTEAFESMEPGQKMRRFRAADSSFHLAIADAAKNAWMRRAIEDARAAIWMPVDLFAKHAFRTAQLHHAQILEAIRDRDPGGAEAAVVAHIETTRRDLRQIASAAE
jgi:GntR family transcriptional regulator, transcriptional repressor for pyruvate dehydrogenase complex